MYIVSYNPDGRTVCIHKHIRRLQYKLLHCICSYFLYSGPSLSGHSQQRLPSLMWSKVFCCQYEFIYIFLSQKVTSLMWQQFLGIYKVALLERDYYTYRSKPVHVCYQQSQMHKYCKHQNPGTWNRDSNIKIMYMYLR